MGSTSGTAIVTRDYAPDPQRMVAALLAVLGRTAHWSRQTGTPARAGTPEPAQEPVQAQSDNHHRQAAADD